MKPIPFDSLWLTWWIPPAWAVWRFALLIRGVLMRTAYFIDGIFAWFERAFAWLAQKFRRGGSEMHDQRFIAWLQCWFEHLDCQQQEILKELHDGELPSELVKQIETNKATRLALTAALAAAAPIPPTH